MINEGNERRSGWAEYQQLVMSELKYLRSSQDLITTKIDVYKDYHDERFEKNMKETNEEFAKLRKETNQDFTDLKVEMAKIKGYAAAYGSIAGLAVTIVLHFWKF